MRVVHFLPTFSTPNIMHQSGKYLSIIGMSLYFSAVNLGAALTTVSKSFPSGSGKIPMLAHLGGVFAVALALSLVLRFRAKNAATPRPFRILPALLAAASLLCLASPLFISAQSAITWQSLIPPALAMCLFLPVGLHVFFETVPPERYGLFFGLAMGVGELVWVAVLPLLYLIAPEFNDPEPILYMLRLLGFVMTGIGACFAAVLVGLGSPPSSAVPFSTPLPGAPGSNISGTETPGGARPAPGTLGPDNVEPEESRQVRAMLLLLFGAGILNSTLFGITLLNLPRAADSPHLTGYIHFFLTLAAPLAGALLDRTLSTREQTARDSRLQLYFTLLLGAYIAAVPVLSFATGFDNQGALPVLLLAGRQVMLLTILVLTAKTFRKNPFFPLVASFTWGLMLFHLPGIFAGNTLLAFPAIRGILMVVLAAGAIFCLRRTGRAWSALPARLQTPENPETPAPENENAGKLHMFAATFSLTKRETEVLGGIVRHVPHEQLGATLGISESTIRFHQTGLLRKTDMASKRHLAQFFAAWKPE